MKNDAVIYLDDSLTDADLAVGDLFSPSLIEQAAAAAGIGRIFYSVPQSYSGNIQGDQVIKRSTDDPDGWISLFESAQSDNIVKIYADAPFIDPDVIKEMLEIHTSYQAEFTYSENLPAGLSCEIYSSELISLIPPSDGKRLPISSVVKANINQFDVELYYKGPDIRDKRLTFRLADKRNRTVMQRILEKEKAPLKYETIRDYLERNPEVLFIAPAYYEIELTGKRSQQSLTSPLSLLSSARGELSVELLKKITAGADAFGYPYAVSFAGTGDPLNHPAFYSAMETALASPLLEMLIVETDAIAIDAALCDWLKRTNDSRIKFIVEINGYNGETYAAIHGTDNFESAKKNALLLKEALSEKSLYVQIQKINETEPFLDQYYDFWEKEGVQIILMKQNVYLGAMADRRYYDLSPLERTPCWHLQRDMMILADGTVAFCKQDVAGKNAIGNLSAETLAQVWEKRKPQFLADYAGTRATEPNCSACDEWYTFNN